MSHLLPTAAHTLPAPTVKGVPRHSEAAVPQEVHPDPDHQSDSSQTARAEHKCEYRTDDRLQSMKKRSNIKRDQVAAEQPPLDRWHKHTRKLNPAASVSPMVSKSANHELLTVAWFKFHECFHVFGEGLQLCALVLGAGGLHHQPQPQRRHLELDGHHPQPPLLGQRCRIYNQR